MRLPEKCLLCGEGTYGVLVEAPSRQVASMQDSHAPANYGIKPVADVRHSLGRCRSCGHIIWQVGPPDNA